MPDLANNHSVIHAYSQVAFKTHCKDIQAQECMKSQAPSCLRCISFAGNRDNRELSAQARKKNTSTGGFHGNCPPFRIKGRAGNSWMSYTDIWGCSRVGWEGVLGWFKSESIRVVCLSGQEGSRSHNLLHAPPFTLSCTVSILGREDVGSQQTRDCFQKLFKDNPNKLNC